MQTTNRHPIVQISLDLTSIDEALAHARKAVRAGVDWLEAGTPLILAEGLHAVKALRREFPQHPIVADLKTMVKAGRDYGVKVMGDDLGCEDKPAAARKMEDLGVDFIVHHVGYDERRDPEVIAAHQGRVPSPLDELRAVVKAVTIPVQAVGGLSVAEVIQLPQFGVHHLVLGAPLTVDADAFKSPAHDLEGLLREIIAKLRDSSPSPAAP